MVDRKAVMVSRSVCAMLGQLTSSSAVVLWLAVMLRLKSLGVELSSWWVGT